MTYVFPPPKIAFPSPAGGVQIVQWQVNSLYPRKKTVQSYCVYPSITLPPLPHSLPLLPSLIDSLHLFNPLSIPFSISHTLHPSVTLPNFFSSLSTPTLIYSISPILDLSIPQSFLPFLYPSFPYLSCFPSFAISLHPSIHITCTTPPSF